MARIYRFKMVLLEPELFDPWELVLSVVRFGVLGKSSISSRNKKISGAVREPTPDEFVNCASALMAYTLLDAKRFHEMVPFAQINKT